MRGGGGAGSGLASLEEGPKPPPPGAALPGGPEGSVPVVPRKPDPDTGQQDPNLDPGDPTPPPPDPNLDPDDPTPPPPDPNLNPDDLTPPPPDPLVLNLPPPEPKLPVLLQQAREDLPTLTGVQERTQTDSYLWVWRRRHIDNRTWWSVTARHGGYKLKMSARMDSVWSYKLPESVPEYPLLGPRIIEGEIQEVEIYPAWPDELKGKRVVSEWGVVGTDQDSRQDLNNPTLTPGPLSKTLARTLILKDWARWGTAVQTKIKADSFERRFLVPTFTGTGPGGSAISPAWGLPLETEGMALSWEGTMIGFRSNGVSSSDHALGFRADVSLDVTLQEGRDSAGFRSGGTWTLDATNFRGTDGAAVTSHPSLEGDFDGRGWLTKSMTRARFNDDITNKNTRVVGTFAGPDHGIVHGWVSERNGFGRAGYLLVRQPSTP